MKALLEFNGSHHYFENYTKNDYHCPNCGNKDLWTASCGDYYAGCVSYCTSCNHECYLDDVGKVTDTPYLKVIEQLKSGITLEPTTKRGN